MINLSREVPTQEFVNIYEYLSTLIKLCIHPRLLVFNAYIYGIYTFELRNHHNKLNLEKYNF